MRHVWRQAADRGSRRRPSSCSVLPAARRYWLAVRSAARQHRPASSLRAFSRAPRPPPRRTSSTRTLRAWACLCSSAPVRPQPQLQTLAQGTPALQCTERASPTQFAPPVSRFVKRRRVSTAHPRVPHTPSQVAPPGIFGRVHGPGAEPHVESVQEGDERYFRHA